MNLGKNKFMAVEKEGVAPQVEVEMIERIMEVVISSKDLGTCEN